MVRLIVNGVERQVDADPDMPLLWALRDVSLRGCVATKQATAVQSHGEKMATRELGVVAAVMSLYCSTTWYTALIV